ncbi:hypothetical protein Y032_0215g2354 [Ancylostoma ceylanicum]|uniref:FAM192A/Fyv6 N-terminal domain-containing protein n=1 Tax=Ancylostoma ceylanicum TaxID=53326 RepID=A0A016SJ33_9BILA|nr:hypothetical protein Y032_0215g2354 [Ancylostoma ceylanicum]
MIRGIDEDESDFLARVSEMKSEQMRRAKKEEEEAIREAAIARSQQNLVEPPTVSQLKVAPTDSRPQQSKQAAILSTAIKRKSTSSNGDGTAEKVSRPADDLNNGQRVAQSAPQPAVSAMKVIGTIPGIGSYDASRPVYVYLHSGGLRRYSRSKKIPASARLLSRAAPPMHYHTCCDVAQLTPSVAGGNDSASSDSEDEEDPYIPVLQTTRPQKKNTCEE